MSCLIQFITVCILIGAAILPFIALLLRYHGVESSTVLAVLSIGYELLKYAARRHAHRIETKSELPIASRQNAKITAASQIVHI
jgi:hypothetical protein